MPGNALLPDHQGMIITRGLQEWVCLLPEALSFNSVVRLLSWQTHENEVLSSTTIRQLVRQHGHIIRQQEKAEVEALLQRSDLRTLQPQLVAHGAPRRQAAWPKELTATVEAALTTQDPPNHPKV